MSFLPLVYVNRLTKYLIIKPPIKNVFEPPRHTLMYPRYGLTSFCNQNKCDVKSMNRHIYRQTDGQMSKK